MASNQSNVEPVEDKGMNDDIQERLEALDGEWAEGIPDDDRLRSGVPGGQRSSDLDFIQMTGLTRPQPAADSQVSARKPEQGNADDGSPVSFYERGVADVDASMTPNSIESGDAEDPAIPSGPHHEAPSIAELKGIIADLSRDRSPREGETVSQEDDGAEAAGAEGVSSRQTDQPEIAFGQEELDSPEPASSSGGTPAPAERTHGDDIAEAEQFIEALQAQPREVDTQLDEAPDAWSARPPSGPDYEEDGQDDQSVYGKPLSPRSRHAHARRSGGRRAARWAVRLLVLACIMGAVATGYIYFEPYLVNPGERLGDARALAGKGDHLGASRAYLEFLKVNPQHPERANALIEAAFSLQMATSEDFDTSQRHLHEALALLERFMDENPGHMKAGRAQTMIGILNYRLGQYDQAIELLRSRALRLEDPDAALPALRALARAYTQVGEYDAAESMCLQAASMPNNVNADVDYHELGELAKLRAEKATDEETRIQWQREAVEHWATAVRVPGIDPVSKNRIEEKRRWLLDELPTEAAWETGPAALSPVVTRPAHGQADGVEDTRSGPESRKLDPTRTTEPDPAAEAAYLRRMRAGAVDASTVESQTGSTLETKEQADGDSTQPGS